MEFRIWVEVRLAGRVLNRQLVAQVEREATGIGAEEIGLTLEEGKTLLSQVQAGVIHRQVEALQAAHRNCRNCGRKQRIKDRRKRCLRTIFWGSSSVLPALSPLPVSRRQASHGVAAPWAASFGHNTGTSIPLCRLGQQGAVS